MFIKGSLMTTFNMLYNLLANNMKPVDPVSSSNMATNARCPGVKHDTKRTTTDTR